VQVGCAACLIATYLVTSFQAMITIVPVVQANQTLASPRRIIFDHTSEKVIALILLFASLVDNVGLAPAEVTRKPLSPTHVDLSWPLVDYEQRRSRGQPLITFDAGFNPRLEKYAVRAFKPGDYVSSPLSRQDSVMQLSQTAFVNWIVITCDKLPFWPIQIKQSTNLRVIDIFRAIYDTYAQPLTKEEYLHFGRETMERCEASFKQRCEDGPELACLAEKRGILRIDLLRGRRIFKGLYPDRGKVGHYRLFFDDAPRRF
jgi:hypothetical protein